MTFCVGHVEVEDINENYCTHLIYAELGINNEGQVGSLKPNLDFSTNGGKDNLRRFNKKKKYKTNLKTLVGIGGWSQSSERSSKIFADEKKRKVFIESVLSFLTKYQFDGIVLHWVFPGIFGGNPNLDRFTLTKLLKELKTETFTLKYSNETTPGAPHIGVGKITEYFQEAGRMSYMELCQRFLIRSWSVKWEPTQKNPYAFKDDQWVGFENERSLKFKAKYVIDKNLGGVSIFDILDDDVKGLCGEKYPLLKALHNHLRQFNYQ
ncbi:acidic mammalian chitinase-like [Condylostylus longicornis]|uniref:acidic mammalian chitinase-like n=1 Tax=Condylostylus longicornis TaxID=2530218 RepID=UPI00244DED11|nr:acidic mammalian chitinase-like [Condylostylus longicornis]